MHPAPTGPDRQRNSMKHQIFSETDTEAPTCLLAAPEHGYKFHPTPPWAASAPKKKIKQKPDAICLIYGPASVSCNAEQSKSQ